MISKTKSKRYEKKLGVKELIESICIKARRDIFNFAEDIDINTIKMTEEHYKAFLGIHSDRLLLPCTNKLNTLLREHGCFVFKRKDGFYEFGGKHKGGEIILTL